MSISRLVPSLFLACTLGAAEIEVHSVADTVTDSGATTQLNAPGKDLILSWAAPDGQLVGTGEVVFRFDTTLIERRLADLQRAAGIARLEFDRSMAQRRSSLQGLEGERRKLRADHAALAAAIQVAQQRDPDQIELLLAQKRQAELAAAIAEREATRITDEHQRGTASVEALESAVRAAALARAAVAGPELAWRLAVEPDGEPTSLQVQRIRLQGLAVKLGLGNDGAEMPMLGIGAQISNLVRQIESDETSWRTNLERSEGELREAERDVQDRTPLIWIEVRPAAGGDPLLRVRFAPPDRKLPEGFVQAGTWDRDLGADELIWRDELPASKASKPNTGGQGGGRMGGRGGPTPGAAPGGGGGGGGGGGRSRRGGAAALGGFSGGLVLLAKPATWSHALPAGRYAVRLGLGDLRDWDGAAIRIEGRPLALPPRLGPGEKTFTQEVEVADGNLDITVADNEIKAVRAQGPGVVSHQGHAYVGFRIQDPARTLSFQSDPTTFVLDTLVAQELAPLLAANRPEAPSTAPLADRVRVVGLEALRSGGQRLPLTVVSIGAQNVRYTRGEREWSTGNPADNTAREVRLRPQAGHHGQLAPGEQVGLVLRFQVPDGATALPPHLVRIDRLGAVVRERGATADRPVEAIRIGDNVLVAAQVEADRLIPPPPRAAGPRLDAQGRFGGEVIPGQRTRVALPWLWGRVESLVADGSQVELGQVVLTVYNPQMDSDRERQERERKAAVQNIIAAAEARRQNQARAKDDHAARLSAEQEARIRLRRFLEPDPKGDLDRREAGRRMVEQATAARLRSERLAGLSDADREDLADAEVAVQRAQLSAARNSLDEAAWLVRHDWFAAHDLAAAWIDKVQALARRESELAESAQQERISTLADRIAMDRAVEGNRWERYFASNRMIKAPAAGRILFQTGWNDQAQRSEKIGEEFPVWSGMSVAEIVDERTLSFTAELPDEVFPRLSSGTACEIEFDAAPGRPVAAVLSEVGRAFVIPRDRLLGDGEGQPVTSRRAFTAIVSFTPPEELRARLATGAKGWLRVP